MRVPEAQKEPQPVRTETISRPKEQITTRLKEFIKT